MEGVSPSALMTASPKTGFTARRLLDIEPAGFEEPLVGMTYVLRPGFVSGGCWVDVQNERWDQPHAGEAIRIASSLSPEIDVYHLNVRILPSYVGEVHWQPGDFCFGDFSKMSEGSELRVFAEPGIAASNGWFIGPNGRGYLWHDIYEGVEKTLGEVPAEIQVHSPAKTTAMVIDYASFEPWSRYSELRAWSPLGWEDSEWSEDDPELELVTGPEPISIDELARSFSALEIREMLAPTCEPGDGQAFGL